MSKRVYEQLEEQVLHMEKQAGMPCEPMPAMSDPMLQLKNRRDRVTAVRDQMMEVEQQFLGLCYKVELTYGVRRSGWVGLHEVHRDLEHDSYPVRLALLQSLLVTARALASSLGMSPSEMTEVNLSTSYREWKRRANLGEMRH